MSSRSLNRFIPVLVASAAALSLHADTTGRIAGKVTNKKGEPLAAAVVTLKRTDISWTKVLSLTSKGAFMQVGLEPKEFDLTVSCKGYVDSAKRIKIPLGDVITDFRSGQDKLDLAAIDANAGVDGDQAFTLLATAGANFTAAGQLRIVQDTAANKTYVEGNVDAGLAPDFRITLDTLVPLKQTDVVL